MTYRMYAAFIAPLSAVALLIVANDTLAGTNGGHPGGVTSTHPGFHRSLAQLLRHHRKNNVGAFWPGAGGFFYEPSNGEPILEGPQSVSGDIHYTYTFDVPWDWVHRYPPLVAPSERPYVPSCSTETKTFPGRDGQEQTANIMRCY